MYQKLPQQMSERTVSLKKALYERAFKDRSGDWFRRDMFKDIGKEKASEPVIIRRAFAIQEMLARMTDPKVSANTGSYVIEDGELIVGVLPMGSNGLGKVFPNYLTENEKRAATVTNRTELSLLGHNTADYERLLALGLNGIMALCDKKLEALEKKGAQSPKFIQADQDSQDFYKSVLISCKAVINYSKRFAELAEQEAEKFPSGRRDELLEMAAICRKVPMNKAETFHEALQSIWTVHVALHASLNYISFGRLDQVLMPYLQKSLDLGHISNDRAVELLECFFIKAAGRLNLSTEYLVKQDHMDFNAALGIHPYYLDQQGAVNNFLQNVIVGGKNKQGGDATNFCTFMILQAFVNTNLSTPGIYVRLHDQSPESLREFVARSLSITGNNPSILNDEALIPAMFTALKQNEDTTDQARMAHLQELANDYCVDGCWEPILNGQCDWTFGMINGMIMLECALNKGATLDPNPMVLRGGKNSPDFGTPATYRQFKEIMAKTMQFFVDQCGIGLYKYYMLDEFINPSPLFSAFLGACLENGRDKSWGGADYNLGGLVLGGVPNMINTVAAIRQWVFKEKRFKYKDVLAALRYNFVSQSDSIPKQQALYDRIKADFMLETPKFGNNDLLTNEIGADLLEMFVKAVQNTKAYCETIFSKGTTAEERQELKRLRTLAGFYGPALDDEIGKNIDIKFTAGLGTFEQYTMQGSTVAASADRNAGAPLAPNFTPTPGTMKKNFGHLLKTLNHMGLERFASGVVTDTCLNSEDNKPSAIFDIIDGFVAARGNMLTLAVGNRALYQQIYEQGLAASKLENRQAATSLLRPYADINVRVGGWQAPFITMSLEQQKDYINRPINS